MTLLLSVLFGYAVVLLFCAKVLMMANLILIKFLKLIMVQTLALSIWRIPNGCIMFAGFAI